MRRRKSKGNRSFIWQAILILLPVVALAGLSLVSLRQDRLVARREAEDRAQSLADDLASRCWSALSLTNASTARSHSFIVDNQGELVFPPPVAQAPIPRPLDVSRLSTNQLRLWRAAIAIETSDPDAADAAFRDFIISNPPDDFAAFAYYSLGVLNQNHTIAGRNTSDSQQAGEAFYKVVEKYGSAVGESGLPLRPLAELHLFELFPPSPFAAVSDTNDLPTSTPTAGEEQRNRIRLSTNGNSSAPVVTLPYLASNVVFHPTPLTPFILERMETVIDLVPPVIPGTQTNALQSGIKGWRTLWENHELARELYHCYRELGSPSTTRSNAVQAVWFVCGDQTWLATPVLGTGTNHSVICRSELEVGTIVSEGLSQTRVPDYMGAGFEVGGRRLTLNVPNLHTWYPVGYTGKGSGGVRKQYREELAEDVLAKAEGGERKALKVSLYLTSAPELFHRQQTRSFWFACMVIASTIAAVIGLATAWRGFHQQQQLAEMKTNFVSSVSHELRAPIASVRLLAESLERGSVPEPIKQKQYYGFIGQECRRLSSLIENVLDFSRIEQGRKEYEFEPSDLMSLTRQTVLLMESYAKEKQIELVLVEPPITDTNWELVIDGLAIQQALINLIDNAVKHSAAGQTVKVGLERMTMLERNGATDQANGCSKVTIFVEDQGSGIPLDQQEKIFERFYRLGSELRRETQGVGIGLSIVKHVVEAHDGKVTVRSAPGEGSRFTIELPVKEGEVADNPLTDKNI